jgi:zinc-ribbon family
MKSEMFLIYGRRTARIKSYTDNQQSCKSCKSFDLDVKVYRDFYHLFFIPFFPAGDKTVKIYCKSCGEPLRSDSIQKQYQDSTKTPFYLYAGVILIAGLILLLVNANLATQKEKKRYVDDPMVGDVYRIRKDENNSTSYYFLRVSQVNGDTVFAYHSNLVYGGFITKLDDEDFFVRAEELIFTRKELKEMLDKDEINSVERDYGGSEGFNRIR